MKRDRQLSRCLMWAAIFHLNHRYRRHIVVQDQLFVTIIPLDPYASPIRFNDCARVLFVVAPYDASTDLKTS